MKPAPLSHELAASAAMTAARMHGCTCNLTVTVREVRPGVVSAECAHEARCRHPSQRKGPEA